MSPSPQFHYGGAQIDRNPNNYRIRYKIQAACQIHQFIRSLFTNLTQVVEK
jgi:hypothetical protein